MASSANRLVPTAFRIRLRLNWNGKRRFVAFSRDENGVVAVEFAIVILPFLALLFAIFETAFVFFADQMLENAVSEAARQIRTGQVQTGGVDENGFKNLVCANVVGMFDCANGLAVDIRSFPDFGTVALPDATNADGDLTNNFTFQPGTSSEVVIVRAFYPWSLLTPAHFTGLSNMTGNKRLLAAAAAFRNEPF